MTEGADHYCLVSTVARVHICPMIIVVSMVGCGFIMGDSVLHICGSSCVADTM
jgi:hypothetical protein